MFTKSILFSALLISTAIPQASAYAQDSFRVTLVGTGTPTPDARRFGPATLVEAGNQKRLFDAGRGVPIRLSQLRIPLARIDTLFITHYHFDHVSEISDVWLTG